MSTPSYQVTANAESVNGAYEISMVCNALGPADAAGYIVTKFHEAFDHAPTKVIVEKVGL